MEFTDTDWENDPSPQQHDFTPAQRAYFDFECPSKECVRGGFDLTSVISTLVSQRGTEAPGSAQCQGWQDRERINKNHCWLKVRYRIIARYEDA
jgi:hypothetical protein